MKRCKKYNTEMNANVNEMSDFAKKVMAGVDKSFNRLVQQRSLEDSSLYFSDEHGRVIKVKARSIPLRNVEY